MIEFLCAICAIITDTFFSEQTETLLAYVYFPKDDLGRSYEEQIEKLLPLLKPGSQIITIDYATTIYFHDNDHNGRSLKAT